MNLEEPVAGATPPASAPPARRTSLLRVAGLIAALTLLSKGFGFFREVVIANAYGAGVPKDAYTLAYTLPAFALVMLGGLNGPFHTSALTALTRLRDQGRERESGGVIATLCLATVALMGVLTAVTYVAAPLLIHTVIAPGAPPATAALAATELRIMAPLVLLGGLIGVLCGVGNARDQYALPSLSPLVASLAVVLAIVIDRSPLALAWGTLVGAVGQLLLQALPLLPRPGQRRAAGSLRPVPLSHPAIREAGALLVPAAVSSSIGTINVWIGFAFASSLAVGSVAVFDYANKLLQLPLGILLTALLVPLLPRMTTAFTAGDRPTLHLWINRGVQTVAITTFLMTAGAVVVGAPLIRLAFQHGAFTAQATHQTYLVLAFSAASLAAYAWRDLFTRVFYAMNDSKWPLVVSVASIAFNLGYNTLLIRHGVVGLASAYSLVTLTNLTLMAFLLRRKLGTLGIGPSLPTLAKCAVAAALGALACRGVARFLPQGSSMAASLVQAGVLGTLLVVVYAAVLVAWRVPLLDVLRRRTAAVSG